MTTKDWLMRAWHIDREVNALQAARDEEFARCASIVQRYDGDVVSGTMDPHKFDRLAELDSEIDSRIDALWSVKQEIIAQIAEVDNVSYRTLLTERYVSCKKWEQIAVDMGYDYRWVLRLHGHALLEINNAIESHTKPAV